MNLSILQIAGLVGIIGSLAAVGSLVVGYLSHRHQIKLGDGNGNNQANSPDARSSAHSDADVSTTKEASGPNRPAIEIPDGYTLGSKVVLVPGLQSELFTYSGYIDKNIWDGKQYCWVERGDVIGRYHMRVESSEISFFRHFMGSKYLSVEIKSPVSGLLLNNDFNSFGGSEGSWPSLGGPENRISIKCFALLVADDEPTPKGNNYIYRELINFIFDHKAQLFRRLPFWSLDLSRYGKSLYMTEERFLELVKEQEEVECLTVDAMPRYELFFDEARIRHPSLRPHLKHLL